MQTHTVNRREYYLSNDLIEKYPKIFTGHVNSRRFVDHHELSEGKDYIFARRNAGKYTKSNGNATAIDKVLLSKEWFDDFIEEESGSGEGSGEESGSGEGSGEESGSGEGSGSEESGSEEESGSGEESGSEEPSDDYVHPKYIPSKVVLKEAEKFIDINGDVISINVVGSREANKIYFKVSDVASGFGLPNLNGTVANKRNNGYIYSEDYVVFRISETNNKKVSYLTYSGLLRALFSNRSQSSTKFIMWAANTLFAAHLGTETQKKSLVGKLLGVSTEEVHAVFSKAATKIPCIYLYALGFVKDLRKTFNIPKSFKDDEIVHKFGMTVDLDRRNGEHKDDFGKLGCTIELKHFGFIDPQYISTAETSLKAYFNDTQWRLDNPNHVELAIFSSKNLKNVKKQFDTLSKAYMGHIAEMVTKLKEKDNELQLERANSAKMMAEKDRELAKKDTIISDQKNQTLVEKHQKELLQKELDISKREIDLLKRENELLKKTSAPKPLVSPKKPLVSPKKPLVSPKKKSNK